MIDKKSLYKWCSVKAGALAGNPDLRIRFRIVDTPGRMGELMAREFCDEIKAAAAAGRQFRAIVPCGPKSWYEPFARIVNAERISMKRVIIFHMDECLDWEGRELAKHDPYNFRSFMETNFYGGIDGELAVPAENRHYLSPATMEKVRVKISEAPVDITLGGFGQDGHIAYNQSRRHPYSRITLDDLRKSSIRVQENSLDTIIALSHRSYGAAYQFVPPMSVTLGLKECLSAKKVRLFSDTGAWKQTALRVALFSEPDAEYPITLLQEHPDAIITATYETAAHPISENPEWEFGGVNA